MKTILKTLLTALALQASVMATAAPSLGRILVVLSGVDYVSVRGQAPHKTGFFMPELTEPVIGLIRAGYEVVIANPSGQEAAMDPVSDDPKWFIDAQAYLNGKELLRNLDGVRHPRKLADFSAEDLAQFDGVFLPGGHAPMEDLVKDANLGRILRYFHAQNKTTGLICHAPVALLSARTTDAPWIYDGYKMTVFSNNEEIQEENLGVFGGKLNYYVQDALTKAGGKLSVSEPWTSGVVRDRELVTGQNPQSAGAFTETLLESLAAAKFRAHKNAQIWQPGSALKTNVIYNTSPGQADWEHGFTTVYIGHRRSNVDSATFLQDMQRHIGDVRENFAAQGLRGYYFTVTDDVEIAYLNWTSEADANKAFGSSAGQAIVADASNFLETVLFKKTAMKFAATSACEASLQ